MNDILNKLIFIEIFLGKYLSFDEIKVVEFKFL